MVALTSFCVVHSFARIPLADFYGIVFLSPMVIALMSALFLKERIGLHRFIAIILGFSGVIILAGPQFETMNVGIIFALISVLFISANAILLRKIGHENTLLIFAFYPVLFSALLNAPFVFNNYIPIDASHSLLYLSLVPLVLIGVIGLALGFRLAPETSVVAPFHYLQIIWGVIFGYYLFNDVPSASTIVGASIIVIAGFYLIMREKGHKV
jgi:S-adenosylmethionine uptake transporter